MTERNFQTVGATDCLRGNKNSKSTTFVDISITCSKGYLISMFNMFIEQWKADSFFLFVCFNYNSKCKLYYNTYCNDFSCFADSETRVPEA